ncbi:MAG TPA: methyltransferase type 11, partial [Acidimicrobiaceae bacterium]|nr:methyltransferase type 11 [Acidimicrobiaceae bacterium]
PLFRSTAPPTEPEFHGDNTPVFWRFGFDLTDQLRAVGFESTLLCTDGWIAAVDEGLSEWPTGTSGEFDVASMLAGVRRADLQSVADDGLSHRFGFLPAYMFLTWECVKPSAG